MKRQYVQSLIAGLGLFCAFGSYAQEGNSIRPIDQQVINAKAQGLFKRTASPFELQAGDAARGASQIVTDATYLQLSPANTRKLWDEHPDALTLSIPKQGGATLEMELVQQSPFDKSFFVSTSSSDGRNWTMPTRPRSKGSRVRSYICQPTATDTICAAKVVRKRDAQ